MNAALLLALCGTSDAPQETTTLILSELFVLLVCHPSPGGAVVLGQVEGLVSGRRREGGERVEVKGVVHSTPSVTSLSARCPHILSELPSIHVTLANK